MGKNSQETKEKVLRHFTDYPNESLRKAAKILNMRRKTIREILDENGVETITQHKKRLETENRNASLGDTSNIQMSHLEGSKSFIPPTTCSSDGLEDFYEPQPYLDIRGVYLGSNIQIILLGTKGVEITEINITQFIEKPISDLLPVSYVSADHLNMAELIQILDTKSDNIDKLKSNIVTPESWFAEVILATKSPDEIKLQTDPTREKLFALVSGNDSEIISLNDVSPVTQIRVDDMAGALSGIMLSPEISRLRASAFPTLAKTVSELWKSNVCSHTPLVTNKAIDLRLKCALIIKRDGLKIAEPHQPFHNSTTIEANITLNTIRYRERKKLPEYKTQVQQFFPGTIAEPGARFLCDEDKIIPHDGEKFVLNLESLRTLILTDSCLKTIQQDYAMAHQAQENFLDVNKDDALIDCAILLGPKVPWMNSPEALDSMIKISDADRDFKPALLSSLMLITIDPSVFIFSLLKMKKYKDIIENNEIDYYKWLDRVLYIKWTPIAQLSSAESEYIISNIKFDFIIKQVILLYPRACELIIQHVQKSLLSTLDDIKMTNLVEDAKETLLRNPESSVAQYDQFVEKVHQDLEPDRMRLCSELLNPWPIIVFDKKYAQACFANYHRSSIRDIRNSYESRFEKILLNSTGEVDSEGTSIEIGDLDKSLLTASGAAEDYTDDVAKKSRHIRLTAILADEAKLLKSKWKLDKKIALAAALQGESDFNATAISYYNALKTGDKSLYEPARMAFLEAMMEYAPEQAPTE